LAPLFLKNNEREMKKILLISVPAVALLLCLVGCKPSKQAPVEEETPTILQPKSEYTREDTVQVRELVDNLLTELNAHQFDKAVSMLSFLNYDSIVPLSKEQAQRQKQVFTAVKGIRYEAGDLIFHEEKDNQVKFRVILFEREPGDDRPNEVSFALRPVRRNGVWYLTMADDMTSTNGKSEIKN